MTSKKLTIYIDGAASGNPGPAGIGVIVCSTSGQVLKNISKYVGETTNNIAEYTAAICALEEASTLKAESVHINTDSELLAKQLNKEYKVKNSNLKPLYEKILYLAKGFEEVRIFHITRDKNKGADKLATKAIKETKKKATSNAPINLSKE